MSLDESGINSKVKNSKLNIEISSNHPLIKLANIIDWLKLYELILPDLKATTFKGKWWLGRKLKIRVHLGIYILQNLYNLTDRVAEYSVRDNAAYQLFCGKEIVDNWHCPDHTKIEEFRSRLSPSTQNLLANEIAKHAVKLGYACSNNLDIDSTISEANMAYPSDSHLLLKLGNTAYKVWNYLKKKVDIFKEIPISWEVDIKNIKAKARAYFFARKNKKVSLSLLWQAVCKEVSRVREACRLLTLEQFANLPWNIKPAFMQLLEHGERYLTDSLYYVYHGSVSKGKSLSLHLKSVSCFMKGKAHKRFEFGRNIQLGRISGNFLTVLQSTNVRMEDKQSVKPMLELHQELFGHGSLESFTSDKGYYSNDNKALLKANQVKEIGLQQPRLKGSLPEDIAEDIRIKLINRRAGIEPLIGHAKHGGQLGRSRMKSDRTTLSGAYASVLGFNLRQLIRHEMGKMRCIAV